MKTIRTTLDHKVTLRNGETKGPYPTLILLHGRGANEDDLLGLVPYLDPRFLFIAPRAPFSFSFGGYTWYDVLAVGTPQPVQFNESYERLAQFALDIREQYPVDHTRFCFLGFSMGAVMSYAYSLTHPEDVNAVVAHSGYIPEETPLKFQWDALRGKGFFVGHGTYDPVIGVEFGRRARELLAKTPAALEYKEYPIPHTMSEESIADISRWLKTRISPSQEHGIQAAQED